MVLRNRNLKKGLILHSYRGIQYANNKFANILNSYKATRSRKGNYCENVEAERFFKSLKKVLIYVNKLISKEQMKLQIFEYIEVGSNQKRKYSAFKYMTIKNCNNMSNNYKKLLT
jgi:putative transposase